MAIKLKHPISTNYVYSFLKDLQKDMYAQPKAGTKLSICPSS